MKKWRCSVCGYVWTGEEPPERCPNCGAPKKMFKLISEGDDDEKDE
ncbi:MAG: rubredoxin-like domain-containing protein [Armatimonadota bacterium]